MAMFDQFFTQPWVVARHANAPFAEERARYLDYCKRRGDTRATLSLKARELLWIARKLGKYPDLEISIAQLWGNAAHWKDRESVRPPGSRQLPCRHLGRRGLGDRL